MLAFLSFAAEHADFDAGILIWILVALIVAAIVYYVAGLFLPHPVPILLALLVLVVVFLSGY